MHSDYKTLGRTVALAMARDNRERGQRIARLRKRRGLTQADAAAQAQVTLRSWAEWEAGGGIRGENLRKVSTILECTIDEITGEAEPVNPFSVMSEIDARVEEFRRFSYEMRDAFEGVERKLDALVAVLLEPSALSEFEAALRDVETRQARDGARDASEAAPGARRDQTASG